VDVGVGLGGGEGETDGEGVGKTGKTVEPGCAEGEKVGEGEMDVLGLGKPEGAEVKFDGSSVVVLDVDEPLEASAVALEPVDDVALRPSETEVFNKTVAFASAETFTDAFGAVALVATGSVVALGWTVASIGGSTVGSGVGVALVGVGNDDTRRHRATNVTLAKM